MKSLKNNKIVLEISNSLKKVIGKKRCSLPEPLFDNEEIKFLKKILNEIQFQLMEKKQLILKSIKNFTKSKYVHAIINGTSALHLSLYIAGVNEKTEVLIWFKLCSKR